jgi:hypothetical protein
MHMHLKQSLFTADAFSNNMNVPQTAAAGAPAASLAAAIAAPTHRYYRTSTIKYQL